ncbi:hypothetical protein AWC25_11660 [Mycobacterium sherrisii]|uniref:Uncharacterized protein n=1 Tax=Mycobacterium sherrisii TaxID=243061 RepID=A0A1E3SQ52_9MYCO|nr:hypothetical protein BHQ21_18530 [Mycobacterium sherrisii]ORW76590.1 hypothetical protein AWC25_11660 [Mycobacterium sherrisii]
MGIRIMWAGGFRGEWEIASSVALARTAAAAVARMRATGSMDMTRLESERHIALHGEVIARGLPLSM